MTIKDKQIFICDFGAVNWMEYVDVYIFKGITVSLLKDRADRQLMSKNARKMKFIHYSLMVFLFCSTVFLFYMIISYIYV